MIEHCNPFVRLVRRLWIFCVIPIASILCSAQMQEIPGASLPQRGSEQYWSVVDEFADATIHMVHAKRFVQLHEGSLSDRQCQEYLRLVDRYNSQLSMLKQSSSISANRLFWSDVRVYSSQVMGNPGVPIPRNHVSTYWITTGSKAEDDELRGLVSLQLDEAEQNWDLFRR
jgi:hypothetical protein